MPITIKHIPEDNINILDISELKQLRIDQDNHRKSKLDATLKTAFCNSTISFFDCYIAYCNNILGGKNYTDKHVSDCIFKEEFKSELEFKEYLKKSIYISKDYVEFLRSQITPTSIHKYDDTISSLVIDLEWLIIHFEVTYKKTVNEITPTSGRRKNLTPTDIYSAAKQLFYIEHFDTIDELYLRDLKPVVMFQIRQLLEVFGRNVIGYYSVLDSSGNTIKKFTQIGWDYIKEEIKKSNPKIDFPFDVHMILAINGWSNSFVHRTHIYSSYIQHFALNALKVLFIPSPTPILIYTGKTSVKFDCSAIKIKDYNQLKAEFENYLTSRLAGIVVEWQELKNVGAYIINE